MNDTVNTIRFGHSACPHDCPSTCALDVELLDNNLIGRIRGAADHRYTQGVVCAKVARYSERIHHPDRLLNPLQRYGEKGSDEFREISWDAALDLTAEALIKAEEKHGAESVWPHYYAGTMGLVMRDGINRLRHVKKYSGQYNTICTMPQFTGLVAGAGQLTGPDPCEMAESDLVVIWGTNAVHTQVNVMTHAMRARKNRGAKIAVVDVYENSTMSQADIKICLKPGTDGALAVAIMHVLFRDGLADWEYLRKYSDCPEVLEKHVQTRTPQWASEITGLRPEQIEEFAREIGKTPRTFFRLGYGFARSRNGAINMHAVSCIPVVTAAWLHEGGGTLQNNGGIYNWNKTLIEGLDCLDPDVRILDQSRIGHILTNDPRDIADGPPVTAIFIQNTNPVEISPNQSLVNKGFARDDLFVCVHEQFLTETARVADIVFPATMFLEHDDIYQSGGHHHIQLGRKLIDPPGQCRSNHEVISSLAKLLGAVHPGFELTARELIDQTLLESGQGTLEDLENNKWIDCQPDFETAHFINGFGHSDGKFHFHPDWKTPKLPKTIVVDENVDFPELPDHWDVIEAADDDHPFRLVTAPARNFLNTSFTETPTGLSKDGEPTALIHPDDIQALRLEEGQHISIGNQRGEVTLIAKSFSGIQQGVVIVEGIVPNRRFSGGKGINSLTGADQIAPYGGAAFHDNHVWIKAKTGAI